MTYTQTLEWVTQIQLLRRHRFVADLIDITGLSANMLLRLFEPNIVLR